MLDEYQVLAVAQPVGPGPQYVAVGWRALVRVSWSQAEVS